MNVKWTNSLVDDIIDKIRENLIVPIIGPGAFYVSDNDHVSVQQYSVSSIIDNCHIDPNEFDEDDASALSKGDFRSMSVLKKKLGKDLRVRLKEFYKRESTTKSIRMRRQVKEFLQYGQFPLILTTCNFRYWEDLTYGSRKYDIVSYKEEQNPMQDIALNDGNLRTPTIFHLLGYVGLDNHVVITENDFLRYLHGYHDINSYPKNLKEYLKDKYVLSVGSEIPDWTVRFLLYSLKESDILQENVSGNDSFEGGFLSINLEKGLSKFLNRISYFSHTNVSGFLDDINTRLTPEKRPKIFLSIPNKEYESIGERVKSQLNEIADVMVYHDYSKPQYWEAIESRLNVCDYFMPIVSQRALLKLLSVKDLEADIESSKDIIPGLITEWMLATRLAKTCIPVLLDIEMGQLKQALIDRDKSRQKLWPLFFPESGNEAIIIDDISELLPDRVTEYMNKA